MTWWDFLPDISLPESIDFDLIRIGDDIEGDQIQGDVIEGDPVDAEVAIRHEGEIIPINEIRRIVQAELPGDTPVDLSEDRTELILDPENLQEEDEWEEKVKPALTEGWREEGSVSTRHAYPILFQAERTINDEKVSEIKEFFRGEVFSSDFQLLQSTLTIDKAMNAPGSEGLSDRQLKERKRELADKYHKAAFSMPSMCTAGYFDEDEIFRYVHDEMQRNQEYDLSDYDRVFRVMIHSKPFVAFVEQSNSPEEVADIVIGKMQRLSNYEFPIPYVDVRGIGRSNHETIRQAMDDVEERIEDVEYDEIVDGDELCIRIDAESVC